MANSLGKMDVNMLMIGSRFKCLKILRGRAFQHLAAKGKLAAVTGAGIYTPSYVQLTIAVGTPEQ